MFVRSLFLRVKMRNSILVSGGVVGGDRTRYVATLWDVCCAPDSHVSGPRWLPGSKHLLSTYYAPGTVLGDVARCVKPALWSFRSVSWT